MFVHGGWGEVGGLQKIPIFSQNIKVCQWIVDIIVEFEVLISVVIGV